MDHYGILSLLPPLVAIVLAIWTRQVYLSLLMGIWLGWLVINKGNPLTGTFDTVQGLVNVFQDPGNTRTIMFCALVGALILFIQKSGGVEGYILRVNRWLEKLASQDPRRERIWVQLLAWLTGMIVFVETSISLLTVGTLYRPLFDRLGISREKLAYIADSTSAPTSIIIPFNGWGAFIMGLLAANEFAHPFSVLFQSMVYNFYPFLALALVLVVILTGWDFGPMKKAEKRVRETGAILAEGSEAMIAEDLIEVKVQEGVTPRAFNMVIPIAVMVLLMPLVLAYTGWGEAPADAGFLDKLLVAIGKGSGSTAVLMAVLGSILVSMVLYRAQGIFKIPEMIDITLKGISSLMPLALLMMLAFAISGVCKELHTGQYVAEITRDWLSPAMAPLLVFLVSCFIAFSTGTSWGTFAIMIGIAIPMARELDANVFMVIGAVMGGGVFGDHCSPISDTTILASMASATDHIDHVRTQLPYALLTGGLAALGYLGMGLFGL
ncbi:MAG: sodium:solute symporter [Saprospirales bacterium]|nr:sodium:solute symporter [Saprospirales bacterium]